MTEVRTLSASVKKVSLNWWYRDVSVLKKNVYWYLTD